MEKIPTAEEFLLLMKDEDFTLSKSGLKVSKMMIEFAKLHVTAALKEAWSIEYNTLEEFNNCYPLTNIK
jgi:hypothetical protein